MGRLAVARPRAPHRPPIRRSARAAEPVLAVDLLTHLLGQRPPSVRAKPVTSVSDRPQRVHADVAGRRPRTATVDLPQYGHLTIDIITARVRTGRPAYIRGSYPNPGAEARGRAQRAASRRLQAMADAAFEEHDLGISWLPDPGEVMQRACHAVRLGGSRRVWIIDPVDVAGLDERIESLAAGAGIAGVIQLLDRHNRDCVRLAERHGVPLHRLPFAGIAGSGLESVKLLDTPLWRRSRSSRPPTVR